MPREKDPFRKYVTFLNENKSKWRCNFCKLEFGGGATRIKAHLAGLVRFGIKGCEGVNVDVKEEAREILKLKKGLDLSDRVISEERMQGNVRAAPTSTSYLPNVEGGTDFQLAQGMLKLAAAGVSSSQYDRTTVVPSDEVFPRCNKENRIEASSFLLGELDIFPPTATQVHWEVLEGGANMLGPSSPQALDMNESAPMTSHPNTGDKFEENRALKRKLQVLYSREADLRDELQFAACLSLKKPRIEVANWLADVEKLRNEFHSNEVASEEFLPPHQHVDILMREAEDFMRGGLFEVRETKVSKLLEEKMVGEAFQRNTAKILECLVGNQVSRLGIYGMGGVGKTTIMTHVHNRLVEKANYGDVLWITVSPDLGTQKLQDAIWKGLGFGIIQEKNVRKRATMLSDCLMKRGKTTIIFDDVWEPFDLKEVGIHVRANGCKLVLTTRSLDVCRRMLCQENIKIEPLFPKEAEDLFLGEVGWEVALNLEVEAIVKSIVKECGGLPLGIITLARSMRGVIDVFEWKDCLAKLRESDMGQMAMEKVLMILKFSYDRLRNDEIQQCFLSCALYPEDRLIDKLELIELFIDQGLLDKLETREEQYFRGLTILKKLENVCLLEDRGSKIKMHNLIRDMALHVMSATSIVKARKGLTMIPPEEYWTEALEKVSLMENYIREFPLSMSPNCPKLSICLLNRSFLKDVVIPDSFFKLLWGLKVLNLSGCKLRELPNSISDLVNLRALLLRECKELRRIPHLGKLRSLRKLDIWCCVHLEALEGLEMLVSLRYLDLTYTPMEKLPKGTLGGFLNLQYLKAKVVNGEDITKLGALQTFECYFVDVDDFNKCVGVIKQSDNRPYYKLKVDQEESKFYVKVGGVAGFGNCERSVDIRKWSHAIVSVGEESTGTCILIPQDVQTFVGKECDDIGNLSSLGPLKNLESLNIDVWKNLRSLCGGQDKEITNIHDSPSPTPAPYFFSRLRVLKISRCPKLKYLFEHGPKFYLPFLQEIRISHCEEMMGITAVCTSPVFPNLKVIEVSGCDKMRRVVESEWLPDFPDLEYIIVRGCENMEEIIGGPPPNMPPEEISLKSLVVLFCNKMRRLFQHEWLGHLRNLQSINVNCCKGMVEMISGVGQGQEGSIMTIIKKTPSSFQCSISLPKLKCLYLHDLPQLKSICEVPITCDSMEHLKVYMCPQLNGIPLQLRLCDDEDFPYIEMEDEEKLKMLMCDQSNAQGILQSHSFFRGNTYVQSQLRLCDDGDFLYIEKEDEEKLKTLMCDQSNAQGILQSHSFFRGNTYVLQGRRSH